MLFLHNTSHVEDEPYPNLLREMGFGGFPSLAFLEADGTKIASPSAREVANFASTLTAINDWRALSSKKSRKKNEEARLLLAELALGRLDLAAAKERLATVRKALSAEQLAEVTNEIDLIEIGEVLSAAGRDRAKAYATFAEMAEAGRRPRGPRSINFWFGVMTHALESKNAKLLESALGTAKTEFAERAGIERALKRFEDGLAELKKDG